MQELAENNGLLRNDGTFVASGEDLALNRDYACRQTLDIGSCKIAAPFLKSSSVVSLANISVESGLARCGQRCVLGL